MYMCIFTLRTQISSLYPRLSTFFQLRQSRRLSYISSSPYFKNPAVIYLGTFSSLPLSHPNISFSLDTSQYSRSQTFRHRNGIRTPLQHPRPEQKMASKQQRDLVCGARRIYKLQLHPFCICFLSLHCISCRELHRGRPSQQMDFYYQPSAPSFPRPIALSWTPSPELQQLHVTSPMLTFDDLRGQHS